MGIKATVKYESDAGTIHPLRIDDDRKTLVGTAPTGAQDSNVSAKVTKSTREAGLKPRGVRLVRTVGTAPNQFKKYTFLPVLTETALAGTGFDVDSTITINSVAWKVAKRIPEDAD